MNFTDLIKFDEDVIPMQERLLNDKNDIFMWGTGALARNIYQYCRSYGILLRGCFVNVPVGEKKYFENIPIYSLDEILEKWDSVSVIIAHSNYAEGVKFLEKVENVKQIYCISNICCRVWENISIDFIRSREDVLNKFYDCLQDKWSKECMISYFQSRMNDNASYMFPYFEKEFSYYSNDIIKLTDNETLLDVGACVGTAIWPFIDAVDGKYRSIIALEPEQENYEILERNIRDREVKNIMLKKICAYNKDGYAKFVGDKEQGGIREDAKSYILYPAMKIDSLCEDNEMTKDISIIKINFPFSVPQILDGASELLRNKKPRIIIRIGFCEDVLINTYTKIKNINSDYKFYLRYSIGIPQGLTLYAQ